MDKNFEKTILRLLCILGMGALFNLIRKPPMKDWIIVFLLKSYIASILDVLTVKKEYVKYPVNLFKIFDISLIFSYLLFPLTCVYFNQITDKSRIPDILLKTLCFSFPMAMAENWLEKNTKLIRYQKSWDWRHSFLSMASTFLLVRSLMYIIKKREKGTVFINEET
ncbi:MAG TPA: CBO0543 family protein [Bacillus sp. (in: firmicutes)]|nr:CBO0543 family protein [Bacillus sp. (in: firmicutes)]